MNSNDNNQTGVNDEINNPELDAKGKPTKKAIESADQAIGIGQRFRTNNRVRNDKNALIQRKYDGAQPFEESDLKNANQLWRNNFATLFMATHINRVIPGFVDLVNRLKFLTNAKGKDIVAPEKVEIYQRAITKLIRQWPGWRDFINLLSQEECIYGQAAPIWMDQYDWRPTMKRGDEIFFPEGVGQNAKYVQVFAYEHSFLIHELIELIENRQAAEDNGWNIENTIDAINKAKPKTFGANNDSEKSRQFQDMVREGNLAQSYQEDSKTIDVVVVQAVEYKGGICQWMVLKDATQSQDPTDGKGKELRYVEKIFDKMEDAVCLFTMETGNGKYYGSKGLGRQIVNIHTAIERSRCMACDQAMLSGLVLMTVEDGDLNSIQPRVNTPFLLVSAKGATVVPNGMKFNYEAFLAIDNLLNNLTEVIVNTFIPNKDNGGEKETATEASITAAREEQIKQWRFDRFRNNIYELVAAMQRKACNEENLKQAEKIVKELEKQKLEGIKLIASNIYDALKRIAKDTVDKVFKPQPEVKLGDPEAVQCIVEMMQEGLSVLDIYSLANSPAADMDDQISQQRDAARVQFANEHMQDPAYDQIKLRKMKGDIMIGEEMNEELLLPENDPSMEAEQTGKQIMEFVGFMNNEIMPVSPRDNHEIHLAVLEPKIEQLLQGISSIPDPQLLAATRLALDHYNAHIEVMRMRDGENANIKNSLAKHQNYVSTLQAVEQTIQQLTQQSPQVNADPNQAPIPIPQGVQPLMAVDGVMSEQYTS